MTFDAAKPPGATVVRVYSGQLTAVLREIGRSGLFFLEVDSASLKKSQQGAYTVNEPSCIMCMENGVDPDKPRLQTSV
jgi:hypothetical protein